MYTLYNKMLGRFLKHPKDGVWASDSEEEAQELLTSAKEYVKAVGIPEMAEELTVVEISMEKFEEKING
jgi:hypothetical protein